MISFHVVSVLKISSAGANGPECQRQDRKKKLRTRSNIVSVDFFFYLKDQYKNDQLQPPSRSLSVLCFTVFLNVF